MEPHLYLGNRNYSSWSLRAWIALRWAGVAFGESLVELDRPGYGRRRIAGVLAVSPSAHTQRRLALVWGVETLLVPDFQDTDAMLEQTIQAVRRSGLEPGRRVVITGGVPFGKSGQTNLIKVHTV